MVTYFTMIYKNNLSSFAFPEKHKKTLLCFLCLLLFVFCCPVFASAKVSGGTFFMGEDVLHPTGFVLTVNDFVRRPFQTGLGGQGRLDEVYINLTLVNTGVKTFSIDPLKDFALELLNSFPPTTDQEGKAAKTSFNVFPSTQSRIDIYFKIDSEQTVTPVLKFCFEDSEVSILCDPELEKLLQKTEDVVLSTEQAVKIGGAFIDAGRYQAAEKIVHSALDRDPANTQLLMQMAGIEDAGYNSENAMFYLRQIKPSTISTQEEAVSIARMAVKLGFYSLAVAVLEPFETVGRLDNSQKILLARAWYYEDNLAACAAILDAIIREGGADEEVYFSYANLYDKQNNTEKAIENWEKAVAIAPDYAEAQFNLGVGYLKL
ncbi:MAG: tetratricopeptide repeat protein, partial [Candidatus Riflebacteria bacterium]|nr:tetratricopeptide repeat protein [Candidatus Riflebacteria bacterium]